MKKPEDLIQETIESLQSVQENIESVKVSSYGVPPLAGVKEACEILGWDYTKQRTMVHTYIRRGKFPEPIARLAYGPIWTVKQIEEYRDSRNN